MTPNQKLAWPIAWEAVTEIARSEGCKLKAYRCPAGVLTIAWGRTKGVKAGDKIGIAWLDNQGQQQSFETTAQ